MSSKEETRDPLDSPRTTYPFNHFAPDTDNFEADQRPCLTCGATVPRSYWHTHTEWHSGAAGVPSTGVIHNWIVEALQEDDRIVQDLRFSTRHLLAEHIHNKLTEHE